MSGTHMNYRHSRTGLNKKRIVQNLLVACSVLAIPGMLSANPLLTAASLMVVPMLVWLLWRPGEPPVLVFAAMYQWLQVVSPVFSANFYDVEIGSRIFLPEMHTAAWLGLIALLTLATGMRIGAGRGSLIRVADIPPLVGELSARRLAWAYIATFVFSLMSYQLAAFLPGTLQLILALGALRWIVVFLILWAAAGNKNFRRLAVAVLIFEIIIGFGGYFSEFKFVIYLGLVVIVSDQVGKRRILDPKVIATGLAVLVLGGAWQAIKVDYRAYLNQGTGMQAVLVSPTERFNYVVEQVLNLEVVDFQAGLESIIDRFGYLEFFARSIRTVPVDVPHQQGRLWGEAVAHVFMPRLLFPGKPAINDSDRTNEFSGILVADAEQGTSISLGYAAESYIDFGPLLMFLPILVLGVFWGWGYHFFVRQAPNRLLGISVGVIFIMQLATLFETSNFKLVGGGVTKILVLGLLLHFFGKFFWRLLCKRGAGSAGGAARATMSSPVQVGNGNPGDFRGNN